jgi:hypothetical protein
MVWPNQLTPPQRQGVPEAPSSGVNHLQLGTKKVTIMARKSSSQQSESATEDVGGSRTRSRSGSRSGSSSTRSASSRGGQSQGRSSSSSRGGSQSNRRGSQSNRGESQNRGRESQNENWQSQQQQGGYDRDYERGYQGSSGHGSDYGYQGGQGRGWESERQGQSRGRGSPQQQDWGNRGYQTEGYESRGSGRSRDQNSREFMSEDRGYGDRGYGNEERGFRGRSGGGFQDDDVRGGFIRQDYGGRGSSDRDDYSARQSQAWNEGRGYGGGERGFRGQAQGGERGFGSGRGEGGERSFGRERSFGGEHESSFREREFAPERGRSEGFRGDDRFGGYAEDDSYRASSQGQRSYQNEDMEDRYHSGRGQRNYGGSESRRGSSGRGSEQRWRE